MYINFQNFPTMWQKSKSTQQEIEASNAATWSMYLKGSEQGSVGAWKFAGGNSKGFSPINVPN